MTIPPVASAPSVAGAQDANPAVGYESPQHAPADEVQWVEQAQAGDRSAFRRLYQRYARDVHVYAIRPLISDPTLAEDLLAETFVRALENIGRFRWQGRSILPWLIRIAKNACFDHLRRAGRSAPWSEDLERALACVGDGSGNKMEQIVGAERARQVLRERISQCLEHINPRYRRVLELRLVRGLGREQSAAELEVSLGTLDVLLCRACKAFRAQYLARFAEPSTEFGSP